MANTTVDPDVRRTLVTRDVVLHELSHARATLTLLAISGEEGTFQLSHGLVLAALDTIGTHLDRADCALKGLRHV